MIRAFGGIILVAIGVGNFESNPNWFVMVGLCLIGLGLTLWPHADGTIRKWHNIGRN
jgi:uncharacterized membrane protein YhaH (DUF805 family)